MADAIDDFFALNRLLILLTLLVSMLGIINTLQANVLDRVRELGMLRAVGATTGQVGRIVVAEGVAMALVASAMGVPAGLLVGRTVLVSLMVTQTGWTFPFLAPWGTVALALVLAVTCAALGAWIPARQAARLHVADALAWD